MKKVLLTGVALMAFAAAGFAQNNVSTINQSVGGNTTNVNQKWIAAGDPSGTRPDVDSKNTSTITQTGVSNTEGNSANVFQIGTSNAAITQVGKNNAANVDQQNNDGRSGVGFENNATVNQGVGGAAEGNRADITH